MWPVWLKGRVDVALRHRATMNVRLDRAKVTLLREVAVKSGLDADFAEVRPGVWLVPDEAADRLLDAISDEFMKTGLRPDSEPNARGLLLEDLTDCLSFLHRDS